MRIRSLAAAFTGALTLTALLTPASQAAGTGDTTITDVVVNGGAELALGPKAPKTFKVSVTAQDDSGIKEMQLRVTLSGYVYRSSDRGLTCAAKTATTSTCTGSWTVDTSNVSSNDAADDHWFVEAGATAKDGDWFDTDRAGTFTVRRLAALTADAGPEPVARNGSLTVTGKLSRADWKARTYVGYSGRSVNLQFRAAGTSTYRTVKKVTSGTGGALRTTVTPTGDGYWRWTFTGSGTTSTAKAGGDYVDVR
ncbi:calcium-binding protein [Streptomyces sp. NPDC008159]|uniref:calcium-binding protein n=1 Tax=Streptomyces sp. NPDC008159 TaxID=3364817 RepID=UPI0036E6DCCC